jgi:uncharacterized Ntn-hydrolase superfamily protein
MHLTFQRTYAATFSICTVDPDTGAGGVAVASRCLAVGGLVPFARPGVGAIASQACCHAPYGIRGLELLARGMPPAEALEKLTTEDVTILDEGDRRGQVLGNEGMTEEGVDFARDGERGKTVWFTSRIRQVGMVDRGGNAANHNGERIQDWAGSLAGRGFCCQGNLLAGEQVVAAMAEAFEAGRRAGEPMVARLSTALEAGEAAGGDRRGKQAAGILIATHEGGWTGTDRFCDLRVDDHEDPVAELGRILRKAGYLNPP